MLQTRRWLPGRELVVLGDRAFAALEFLAAASRRRVACITRLRLDAALYDPAAPRLPGTNGRPRTKGKRLATLSEILTDPATPWQRVTVPGWYDGNHDIEVSTNTAVWRHGGTPVVPIQWVLVRDPAGRFKPQALLCTDLAQDPVQILRWFAQRWQVEVTFREVRDHLGVETQRQWADMAIARTTPCLLGLFSLVSLLGKQLTPHARRATHQRLVSQATSNLLGHPRRRAPGHLERTGFWNIQPRSSHDKTPTSPAQHHHLRTLPRCVMAKVELS